MGKRVVLGVVAVLVAGGFSAASAPVAVDAGIPTAPLTASLAPIQWQPTYDIDPNLADKLVAETPRGVAIPDQTTSRWDCNLPMSINYSAAPGVDRDKMLRQVWYAVRYLQDLGYFVGIGNEVPYEVNAPMPSVPGSVLIVATPNRSEQAGLASGTNRGNAWWTGSNAGQTEYGIINLMSTNGMSSDVVLHELGHVLGLAHKDGSVMTVTADSGLGFDGAETAAIDCRG